MCHSCDPVCWVIRLVLLIYAAFVAANLPQNIAVLFDNTIVRLVLVLLVLALGTIDPASAILLTICFVLSIQTANKHHLSGMANRAATSGQEAFANARTHSQAHAIAATHAPNSAVARVKAAARLGESDAKIAAASVGKIVDAPVQLAQRDFGDTHAGVSPTHAPTPLANDATPHPNVFTSPQQLAAMQTNAVSSNQDTEVRTWKNELGPQGLTHPQGISMHSVGGHAPFAAGPNC